MPLGPIELLVVRFPGNQFRGEITPALKELVDTNTIRVIDIIFLKKDANGDVTFIEITELDDVDLAQYDPIVDDVTGMLSEEDIAELSELVEPNSSAALMLFENVWATRFANAIRNAKGELVYSERIPRAAIEAVLAAS